MSTHTSTLYRNRDSDTVTGQSQVRAVITELEEIRRNLKHCPGECADGKVLLSPPSGQPRREDCPVLNNCCAYGQKLEKELDAHLVEIMRKIGVPERHLQNMPTDKHTDAIKAVNLWFFRGFLVMSGRPGVGKSFGAAHGVAKYLKTKINGWADRANWKRATAAAEKVAWATAQEIVSDKALAGRCRFADFVVIDDLGKEFASNAATTIICDVICRRYDDRKPALVTTELLMPDITNRYGRYIAERFGEDLKSGGRLILCANPSMRFATQTPQQ